MKFRFLLLSLLLCVLPLGSVYGRSNSTTPNTQVEKNKAKLLQTKSCPSCDLSGVNLNRADLKDANLQGANLSGAKLLLADLARANLKNADLRNASLAAADLSGANLEGADLDGADLSGVFFDAHYKPPAAAAAKAQRRGANIRHATTLATPKSTKPAPPDQQDQFTRRSGAYSSRTIASSMTNTTTRSQNSTRQEGKNTPKTNAEEPQTTTSITEATNRILATSAPRKTTTATELTNQEAAPSSPAPVISTDSIDPSPRKQAFLAISPNTIESESKSMPRIATPDQQTEEMNSFADDEPAVQTMQVTEETLSSFSQTKRSATIKEQPSERTSLSEVVIPDAPPPPQETQASSLDMNALKKPLIDKMFREKRCVSCDLSGVDLSGKDLSDFDLERAVLQDANLTRVTLRRTNLKGANLQGAQMQKADLRSADLYRADFRRADLTDARMKDATIDSTDFTDATGVNTEGASIIE